MYKITANQTHFKFEKRVSHKLCRGLAKLLVCLLLFQTFPLQVLSQTHHWNPNRISVALHEFLNSFNFGPASAEAGLLPTLDVDANGQADALTDGMIILRYLFGFKGQGLINGVLALDAQRTEPTQILAYLDPLRSTMLDVDCNGKADAFTDGMLIARFLMGFTGTNLTNGVLDPAGCRNTPEQVIKYLTAFVLKANVPPEAHAGADQTVPINTIVQLDGHRSIDQNGNPLTYAWGFVQQPQNSTATLLNSNAFKPTFIADVAGEYVVQLIVNDGQASSDPATVTISTNNSVPVARAGSDRHIQVGETIQLNGSSSYDADGDVLTFSWTILSQPVGSVAALADSQSILPRLTIDVAGIYTIELIVQDGQHTSVPSVVTLSTSNLIPVAHAGPDQVVNIGQTVTLDGHRSYDPNGDLLTFHWAIILAPPSSTATLDDSTGVKPTFNPNVGGTYIFQLRANDGSGECRPDTVIITTGNVFPVAHAGMDQVGQAGETLQLTAERSTDLNGDMLTFNWSLLVKPSGSVATMTTTTALQPAVMIDVPGTYLAQVKVHDGQGGYDFDTVLLTDGNIAPKANAGPDQPVVTGQTVLLDSTGSTDANADSLTHQWNMVTNPASSTAIPQDPTTPLPTLDIDQERTVRRRCHGKRP